MPSTCGFVNGFLAITPIGAQIPYMSAMLDKTASYTFENWQRARNEVAACEIVEATLFTDTWVTGEIAEFGPYAFLNTIAHAGGPQRRLRPAIVLRMAHHYVPQKNPAYHMPMENDFEHYHGGDYLDEMAALASLFLGIRLKAGGVNREFKGQDDRFGRPTQHSGKPDPELLLESRQQIPRLVLPINLEAGLAPLLNFPERSVAETNALIKAARQYQQGVWIADSDPSLAWLMLVSAIEAAMQQWSSNTAPIDQLRLAHPNLVKLIEASAAPELLKPVADHLKQLTRSTKRFVDFVRTFLPAPPAARPEEWMQFSYEAVHVKEALSLIYGHRSKSLHEGTAFPLPMCEGPHTVRQGDSVAVQEKPFGLATSSRGASWKSEKTPMLLNTFEHIVRGALLNWWASLDKNNGATASARAPRTLVKNTLS